MLDDPGDNPFKYAGDHQRLLCADIYYPAFVFTSDSASDPAHQTANPAGSLPVFDYCDVFYYYIGGRAVFYDIFLLQKIPDFYQHADSYFYLYLHSGG